MKALYTFSKEVLNTNVSKLTSYNYDTRHQALKDGYKFVHLFETYVNESDKKSYKYYSTMKL